MNQRQKSLLHLFSIILLDLTMGCPDECICKWKNGKQTVECINKDMLIIPEGMDTGTQVLEFSGNNLRALQKEKFLKLDLINLQKIYLSRCKISVIDERSFRGLTNLVELDLSENSLDTIPTGTFIDIPSLMRLTLNYNPIKVLKKLSFNHLTLLSNLELNSCEIKRIEDGAFIGLHSLEWLHLKNNKMANVNGSKVFLSTLRGVELLGNLWECDCHMLEMHNWLESFSLPAISEPKCKGPAKLAGQIIRAVPIGDLACLPDVSPTTFYLEISEGKNISLLCHVQAIPEAHVSWWFQGQLLQNDSLVAPGMRLIYFIEEGAVNKRSELFIYNTNNEDNGTFICTAENPAGIVYSNFTIRVILREEPQFEISTLHYEFILVTMTAAAISLIILIIILILSLIRCYKTSRLRRKRELSKLHDTKDSLLLDSVEDFSEASKDCGNLTLVDRSNEIFYNTSHMTEELSPVPHLEAPILKTPTSLRRYQLEQNPDLINDTRKEGDGKSYVNFEEMVENIKLSTSNLPHLPIIPQGGGRRSMRDVYRHSADVHLNPVGLLNTDSRSCCYRTLPYKRDAKRQSAANPVNRFSREAEFLSRSLQTPAYEHYSADIRYTADGYPVRTLEQETTFSESSVHSCCSLPPPASMVQWPIPVQLNREGNMIPATPSSSNIVVNKKCVGAQTQTESDDLKVTSSSANVSSGGGVRSGVVQQQKTNVRVVSNEVDAGDCPDEGYEGEQGDPC